MPPNAQIYGDLQIAAANNTARHGKGKLLCRSDIEMNGAEAQTLKTTTSNLTVSGATKLSLHALAGEVAVASQAGALTAAGYTQATLSSDTGDVFLEAKAAGKKVDIKTPLLNVDVGTVTMLAGGNYQLTSTTGSAVTQAANDVRLTSDNGDVSATVTDDTRVFKVVAKTVDLGKDIDSTTTTNGSLVVKGDFTVSGTTTTVATVNMTVKDNLVQLNAVPTEKGRFPGLLMSRHADDHLGVAGDESAAFVFDETVDRFKLGYTGANAESSSLAMSRAADLQVEKLYCSDVIADKFEASSIKIPGFETVPFEIAGNSTVAVAPSASLKTYGAYDLIVEGPDGGSHGSWRIAKSATLSTSFSATGASQQGEEHDEHITVEWPANSPPVFKHEVPRSDGSTAMIQYKLKYLSV